MSGLEAWQGQGLDEVLRPVQPTRPVQPSEAKPASLHQQPPAAVPYCLSALSVKTAPWTGMLLVYDHTWLCNDPADVIYRQVFTCIAAYQI